MMRRRQPAEFAREGQGQVRFRQFKLAEAGIDRDLAAGAGTAPRRESLGKTKTSTCGTRLPAPG
jgi:hypothetical protein